MPILTPRKSQGTTTILQIIAGWSSLAARKAHNLEVPGSNPGPATISGGSMSLLFFAEDLLKNRGTKECGAKASEGIEV